MKTTDLRLAVPCLGFWCLLGVASVQADPASSADSAWSALPQHPASELTDPLERRGQEVFHERCAACHSAIPEGLIGAAYLPPMPGTQALLARYRGEIPAALEERTDLVPEFIRAIVRSGIGAMPFYRPTEVSDDDLDALVAYLTRDRE